MVGDRKVDVVVEVMEEKSAATVPRYTPIFVFRPETLLPVDDEDGTMEITSCIFRLLSDPGHDCSILWCCGVQNGRRERRGAC